MALRSVGIAVATGGVGIAIAMVTLTACTSSAIGSGRPGGSVGGSSTEPSSTAAGSTGVTSPSSAAASSGSSTPSTTPTPTTPVRTVMVTSTPSGTAYQVKVWVEDSQTACAAHAYGTPVINYLKAHPCHGLSRVLATTMADGRPIAIARETIDFEGDAPAVYQVAGDFHTLVEKDGTGNLEDLLRAGARFPGGPAKVPTPDAFDAEGEDATVTIVDIWWLDGPTANNAPALVSVAKDLYLQF